MFDLNKSMISKVRDYPDFDKSIEMSNLNIASKIVKQETNMNMNEESMNVPDESLITSSKKDTYNGGKQRSESLQLQILDQLNY